MADRNTTKTSIPNLTLHFLNSSRSHRILWLLEELSLPYQIKVHTRKADMQAPDSLRSIHPLGKAPILVVSSATNTTNTDSTKNTNLVLVESANIIEYLLRNFDTSQRFSPPRFNPASPVSPTAQAETMTESPAFLRYNQLMHFTEGSLMPYLVMSLVFSQLNSPKVPFFIRPVAKAIADKVQAAFTEPNIRRNWVFLEGLMREAHEMGEGYFCGAEISGADIILEYPISAARERKSPGFDKESFPMLWEWMDRCHEREAYKRAVKRTEEALGKKFTLSL